MPGDVVGAFDLLAPVADLNAEGLERQSHADEGQKIRGPGTRSQDDLLGGVDRLGGGDRDGIRVLKGDRLG
jgi:hypothetical protein